MIALVKVTEKDSFRSIVFLSKIWKRKFKYRTEYKKKINVRGSEDIVVIQSQTGTESVCVR